MHRHTLSRTVSVVAVLALLVGLVTALAPSTAARDSRPVVGALGGGDPYYPAQGNGGYDVRHYDIKLAYAPSTHRLHGGVKIFARATQSLLRFSLDLRQDMRPTLILVNRQRAGFTHRAKLRQELIITPRHPLAAGKPFTVYVRYGGVAHSVTDPDGSLDGWIATKDGAFVASEPQGSPTWFPVNDTPRDKATYSVSMAVPKALHAISNGHYAGRRVRGATATYSYVLTRPASSYLITATIGKFDIHTGHTPRGIPYLVAIDPAERKVTNLVLTKLPRMIGFFADRYGRYPWRQTGAIVDNAPFVGYALETVTRPLFDSAPDELTLAHELAHQWYGDTVTLRHWRDIWLNEGFAEFSSWMWDQHRGGTTLRQHLRNLLASPANSDEWNPPPGNPGSAANVFAGSVYDRGAGTLEALREKVGNRIFFRIMSGWLTAHRYGNASVPQFTAYAAAVAHRDLRAFFQLWLYKKGKP